MSEKLTIGGVPFTVVSQEEAEQVDYFVCVLKGTPTLFDDNEEGTCCKCSRAIVFRPHGPKTPKRICIECMITVVETGGEH